MSLMCLKISIYARVTLLAPDVGVLSDETFLVKPSLDQVSTMVSLGVGVEIAKDTGRGKTL